MTALVRIDTLERWHGEPLPHTATTAQVHRQDGTVVTVEVEPYTFDVRHPINIGDSWSDAELWAAGLAKPRAFEAPEGKRTTGAPRYELGDGFVATVFDVEDIPPPPPPLTAEQKLAAAGLTREELRELIAE